MNALDEHIDQPSLLVIDDYHLAASNDVNAAFDHFLSFLPADLEVIVSTRYPPSWEHLVSWRARGEVMDVKHDTLASQLHSPFVSAVGQMRLGHAYQVRGDFRAALHSSEEAAKLGDQIAVRRTRAEACWGMARTHGLVGDLEAARRAAAEGIEIGRSAGDLWIVALVQIALGASLVHAEREREATGVLADALAAFRSCGDMFGAAAGRMWLALAHWRLEQRERAMAHLDEALALARTHRYDYLLTERTLLGWHETRVVIPLLLAAR